MGAWYGICMSSLTWVHNLPTKYKQYSKIRIDYKNNRNTAKMEGKRERTKNEERREGEREKEKKREGG